MILNGRKRSGIDRKVDLPILPIREQGPESLVRFHKYHSKTCMDENSGRTPSEVRKMLQQKRRPIRSALKNGGAENFDGLPVLRRSIFLYNSLFIRQLTGKKQAFEKLIHWILKHCWASIPLLRNIRQKHPKFPTRDNREISGKKVCSLYYQLYKLYFSLKIESI